MAFVVPTKRGRFEIRESTNTSKGPRSHTLASFRELDDEVIRKARERAAKAIDEGELRQSARRAGAPVVRPPVDQAARELITELAKGSAPSPTLRHMLLDLLQHGHREGSERSSREEAEHAVAEWMAATPKERGGTLVDLLLLADALPHKGRKGKPLRFPRLDSTTRAEKATWARP
jgi:hypothetical protein